MSPRVAKRPVQHRLGGCTLSLDLLLLTADEGTGSVTQHVDLEILTHQEGKAPKIMASLPCRTLMFL